MRKGIMIAAATCLSAATLAGCQSVQYEYRQVAAGPDLGTAAAYCEMQSYGVPQTTGVYYGSALYANSMALQATMANQARVDNFFNACMRYAGWQRFEVPSPASPQLPAPPA